MAEGTKKPNGLLAHLLLLRCAVYDPALTDKMLRILALLVTHADKDGTCFPSISKIAERLNVTRQAVQHHVRNLRKAKYIAVYQPRPGRANIYKLNHKKNLVVDRGASSGTGDQMQGNKIAGGASLLPCTKKTEKKPFQENIAAAVRNQGAFIQQKQREADTGICIQRERELEDIVLRVTDGMSPVQKTELSLRFQREAKELYETPLERFEHVKRMYEQFRNGL